MKFKPFKMFLLLLMAAWLVVACSTPAELEGTWIGYEIEDDSLILVTAEPGDMQRPFSFDETEEFIAFVFEKR